MRRMPLRWAEGDDGRNTDVALRRGWFAGPSECARVLTAVAPAEVIDGWGFGVRWPVLVSSGWTLAPALPVAIGSERVVASDGEYRRDDQEIWREAIGVEELFLTIDDSPRTFGEPFDLLWFGDTERFMVRAGKLEIEDLFGVLRVPATAELLERILVRSRRVDREVLASFPLADRQGPQTIEVRRQAVLYVDDLWRDPVTFLTARVDIESARVHGDGVEVRLAGGKTASFNSEVFDHGWCLTLVDGGYDFSEILLEQRAATHSVRATLSHGVDGMAPGMRGRLIFDLHSDLVALGGGQNR